MTRFEARLSFLVQALRAEMRIAAPARRLLVLRELAQGYCEVCGTAPPCPCTHREEEVRAAASRRAALAFKPTKEGKST